MRAYISGPINTPIDGVDLEERKARFYRCEEYIVRTHEHMKPVNPLKVGACEDFSCGGMLDGHDWECWLRYDLKALLDCQAIVLLPGFEWSRGAQLEMKVAQKLRLHPFFANEKGEFIL